eukprot:gnl/TRDRNA2_/TRDRNA2_91905_c0_seq1.p1 gnl/TRDRNA2_/TRDRNA2_91905_c0~~gnl/TRDRNA2_/TRDRNA2_91905_c0_seq1.p1  ORF type:complete len:375 (+),score=100.11 gnl/TRDRNA2_/TRDRNA2_91905_c0_seq1:128-1126(+)
MANAEETLKVLEETKVVFLEQLAEQHPELLKEGLEFLQDKKEKDAEEHGHHGHGDGDDSDNDFTVTEQAQDDLDQDMRRLMMVLTTLEKKLDGKIADGRENATAHIADGASVEPAGSEYVLDEMASSLVTELAYQVESEEKKAKDIAKRLKTGYWSEARSTQDLTKAVEVKSDAKDNSSREDRNADEARGLVAESRSQDEQSRLDLADTLMLFQETSEITEDQDRIHKLVNDFRAEHANPDSFLLPLVFGEEEMALAPKGVSKTIVREVHRKVRELRALRKRWWSDRQDPAVTVSRCRALAELDEGMSGEPPPLLFNKVDLYKRLEASMTLL